jgi:peptidoglycan/LPS O-acetylase OafA/YrhL
LGVARTANYRPEIDGLRAIAILPVLFFHAGIEAFSGGFIGVDIFFVISGYLITRIVAGEIAAGRFTFARFYERRVRRIFPALFCVLIVSTATAAVIFPPSDFFNFAKSLLAITLFASNMFFWRMPAGNGYFDTHSNTQVLLHTWTLSVEEQFYIFLPITLVAIARWAPGRVRLILATAVIASFAFSIWAV